MLDTGSPFALVAACAGERRARGRCREFCGRYGCASEAMGGPTGLEDNVVVTSGARSSAVWRKGSLGLGGARLEGISFGVVSETDSFGGNAGGTNLGLIRTASEDQAIRPTFLSQTPYRSFVVDLRRAGQESVELYKRLPARHSESNAMPLLDLRGYGAPVVYYAVSVQKLQFDGVDGLEGAEAVAIVDTGTTGLALPPALFERYLGAREAAAAGAGAGGRAPGRRFRTGNIDVVLGSPGKEPQPAGALLSLARGDVPEYGGARFDVVTAIPYDAGSIFYRAEQSDPGVARPLVIFLGLGFLLGRRLSVDTVGSTVSID